MDKGTWRVMTTGPPYVRSRSLTGLLYQSIVLSGCLRCPGTHPLLWVNTRPSTHVLVSTMLVESAEYPRHLLVGLGVYHFPVFNATSLHLFIEGDTVKAHVRARWSLYGAVVEMVARDRAPVSSHTMTQLVRDRTFFCKMSPHCAILALA